MAASIFAPVLPPPNMGQGTQGQGSQCLHTPLLFCSFFLQVYLFIIWLLLNYLFHHGPTSTNNTAPPRGGCTIKGAEPQDSPHCDSVGNQHAGRSGNGKNSEFGVRKLAFASPIYQWLCHPGKSPVPTSLSLVPLFINWR